MEKIQAVSQDDFGLLPQWLIGVGVVAFAILCALIAHRLFVSLVKRAIVTNVGRGMRWTPLVATDERDALRMG